MDIITEMALRRAIVSWKKTAALPAEDIHPRYSEECPLCALFLLENCDACPVLEHTGFRQCRNTPYQKFIHAMRHEYKIDAKNHANNEVKFLKSLLK